MPDPITGLIAGVTSIGGGLLQSGAASDAAGAQTEASQAGIAEVRAAREEMRKLLEPYTQAGVPALEEMMSIAGLGGAEAQQASIAGIEGSPIFQSLAAQGEDALLQNASATGGLRGGNIQGALGQFRPAMLNQFIEQQYGRLGGLTSLGQQSAAGVGTAGMNAGNNIATLYGDIGSAQAGRSMAQGQAWSDVLGTFGGAASNGGLGRAFGGLF